MGKFICAGMNVQFTTDNATAKIIITGAPSQKVKCNNLPAWFGKIDIQVTAATQGAFTQTAPMSGSILGSATKVTSNKQPAVLMGDKTTTPVMCAATDPQGKTTTISVTVTVSDAGQTKVMAT